MRKAVVSARAEPGFGGVAELCCSAVSPLETQHSSPPGSIVLVGFVLRDRRDLVLLSRTLMLGRRGAFFIPQSCRRAVVFWVALISTGSKFWCPRAAVSGRSSISDSGGPNPALPVPEA